MTAFLLDVNVLIALGWRGHPDHTKIQRWFARNSNQGWATCPFTQAAFVRIVSNPAFSPHATSPAEALKLLTNNVRHATHEFWPDNLDLCEALRPFAARLVGHQQVTDAYLLALALRKKGKLATLDRGILSLLPQGSHEQHAVELIIA